MMITFWFVALQSFDFDGPNGGGGGVRMFSESQWKKEHFCPPFCEHRKHCESK